MPKRSAWRVAQFDSLRLRAIKLAARVVEMKTMIKLHLPTAAGTTRCIMAVNYCGKAVSGAGGLRSR